MKCTISSMCRLLLPAAVLACALSTPAVAAVPEIIVLSNRADLISGGDALVQINLPPAVNPALGVKVALNGTLINSMFAVRPNGRYMGLVTGLNNGDNLLTVTTPQGRAKITITNHPIGGPVFSGAQLQPWICATTVAQTVSVIGNSGSTPPTATATTRASGLNSDPVDAQCDTPPTYSYYFQPKALEGTSCTFTITGASPCFVAFPTLNDPSTRPADSAIANFTNDRGDTAKSIVRVERGQINRNIYELVTFYDPAVASAPWATQKGWNQKLHWKFGAGASTSRFEEPPAVGTIFDNNALSRGFMVAASHLTNNGSNTNNTLAAETVMMVKERIIENYGEIRYTMSDGCSGGSIMQDSISSAYPGLTNGVQVTCTYQDMFTPWIEVTDCGLVQANYYATPNGAALSTAKRTAINGQVQGFCTTWTGSFLGALNPKTATNCGTGFPAALVYSATNPNGVRCDTYDHDASMLGTFIDTDGLAKANTPRDNIGIQYGLIALQTGAISPEEFVQLNEGAGGYDADRNWVPNRMQANPAVLHTVYTGGLLSDGRQLAKVPMIDMRGNNNVNGCIHANWRSLSVRGRLDQDHGGHGNNVIWATGTQSITPGAAVVAKSFVTMDKWLSNIESDASANPIEVKIVNNKPAEAVDFCLTGHGDTNAEFAGAIPLFDPACPAILTGKSLRQAAGGPVQENIFKCQLKPLNFADPDYTGVLFSANQQSRLQAVFPTGVCDWTKPGVAQTPVNPWTTFAAGPGGQPLPPPPTSVPF
ncbi:MAG TPA: DUF6351 family protein [Casimicrobiaceae bacterium]|jgi:hypothetical protein|nr:DUF6351 family protein [Casimicrobiaceae bacterium]